MALNVFVSKKEIEFVFDLMFCACVNKYRLSHWC